jgi:hypothetical protein
VAVAAENVASVVTTVAHAKTVATVAIVEIAVDVAMIAEIVADAIVHHVKSAHLVAIALLKCHSKQSSTLNFALN